MTATVTSPFLAGHALARHDMSSGPIATVHLPVRVPLGLHGNWLPS